MRNVLFISRQRLVGKANGSSVYLIGLAEAVRNAGMVPHLIQPAPSMMGRWPVLRLKPEMKTFESHHIRGVIKLGSTVISCDPTLYLSMARGIVSRLARRIGITADWARDRPRPYAIAIPWSRADHAFVARHGSDRADVAIADYMFQAEGFDSLRAPARRAVIMHDLFHARAGGGSDSVTEVSRETEFNMLGRADAVIAIQATEAHIVAEALPDTTVILAPLAANPVGAPQPGDGDRVLFVGSNTAPNVVGLRWLFESVWPLVRAKWPDATLDIAGTVALSFAERAPEGVRFLGLVDDLDALYAKAGIVISPLTFGSGLKIKLIEALATGKATVATSITLQGVEEQCRDAVALADDAKGFAEHILRLHYEPETRAALAAKALDIARQYFAPAACYTDFVDWVRHITLRGANR